MRAKESEYVLTSGMFLLKTNLIWCLILRIVQSVISKVRKKI